MSNLQRLGLVDSPALLLWVLMALGAGGCGESSLGSAIARIAPDVLEIPPGDSVRYEIRGCVVEGVNRVSSPEAAYLDVTARGKSTSTGTMLLEFPLIEAPGDQDILSAAGSVQAAQTTSLRVNHYFSDWMDVETLDLMERCTDWTVVEFTWMDVEGAMPLEVTWDSFFLPEVEFDLTLAIDFRELE